MNLNRRGFLKSLFGAAAVAALDPEALLWVPNQKTIFIPTSPVIAPAGNRLITIEEITRRALEVLQEKLVFAQGFDKSFDSRFDYRAGEPITFKRPMRFYA